jgi:hypothetical protein
VCWHHVLWAQQELEGSFRSPQRAIRRELPDAECVHRTVHWPPSQVRLYRNGAMSALIPHRPVSAALVRGWRKYPQRAAAPRGLLGALAVVLLGALGASSLPVCAQEPAARPSERCRDTPRIRLTGSQNWSMTYSWRGGMGPGSVQVTVRSDGTAQVEARASREPAPHVRNVQLPPDLVARLAHAIDGSELLCETPVLRARMQFDIGRFAVRVQQGSYDKEVFADECHALEHPAGLSAVMELLQGQTKLLGPEVSWGPYASSTGPPCSGP